MTSMRLYIAPLNPGIMFCLLLIFFCKRPYCSLLISIGSDRWRSRGSEGEIEVLGSSSSMHCQALQLMEAGYLFSGSVCYDGLEVEESAYVGLGYGGTYSSGPASASWYWSNISDNCFCKSLERRNHDLGIAATRLDAIHGLSFSERFGSSSFLRVVCIMQRLQMQNLLVLFCLSLAMITRCSNCFTPVITYWVGF